MALRNSSKGLARNLAWLREALVALLAVLCLSLPAFSQTFFGPQQVISDTVNRSYDVFAADLDNDGDQDVIGCSFDNHSVFWWENLGSGSGSLSFGPTQLITDQAFECTSVSAADFDGDGLIDIASGSAMDDKVAWYRNLGAGSFSSQIVIATDANATRRIYVADMNGDTRPDILSANRIGNEVAYYPNLGGGSWGPKVVISTAAGQIQFVHAADIEGDGDMDAFSASPLDSKFAWYENLGDTTAVSCDASTPPAGLNSNVTASTVQLSWNPISASVACQIAATRTVPPGPSPSVNLIGSEVSGSNVPIAVLGAGTTWEWRVRCACSIPPDPIVATGFSAANTFSTPSPKVEDSELPLELPGEEVELWSTNGQMIGLYQRSELSRLDLETGVYLIRSSDGQSEKILLGQQ